MRNLHASIRAAVCSFCGTGTELIFVSSRGGLPPAICKECAKRAVEVLSQVEAYDAAERAPALPAPKKAPPLMARRF